MDLESEIRFYKHSGRFGAAGAATLVAAGLGASAIAAPVYAYALV